MHKETISQYYTLVTLTDRKLYSSDSYNYYVLNHYCKPGFQSIGFRAYIIML